MIVGEHALAVEGGRHRDVQRLREPDQRLTRAGPRGAVAREHDRVARLAQQLGGPGDLFLRRVVRTRHVDPQRDQRRRRGRLLDVLGHGQVDGARTLGLRQLERLADHLGRRTWGGHQRRPLGDRGEHRHQVDSLVRLLEAARHADLRRQRDQRRGVGRRVGGAEQQVDRTGTERRGAHAGLPRQPPVGLGHERGALFVPGEHVGDRGPGQRLHQPDVLLARDAEDVRHALVLQALNDQLRGRT